MELTWWGTAGFRIETAGAVFLIDPYLSRNARARPSQPLAPTDVVDGEHIFVSHGHFDHILDIPVIAARTGAKVYADPTAARTMIRAGLDPSQVVEVKSDGQAFELPGFKAQAFFSEHVKFDRLLVIKTLLRANLRLPSCLALAKAFPAGQVLSWRFTVDDRVVHHFGSGGSPPEELTRLARRPTDVLLVPLQGHTKICDIALDYVRALRPKLVIPHHQDDFYPPISRMVDIEPFVEGVRREFPDIEVQTPVMNEPMVL